MRRWSLACGSLFVCSAAVHAAAAPEWPTLQAQLTRDRVAVDSPLARLIAANQDFSMLRAEEANDLLRIPLWLRVYWRKAHPEMEYPADDPTGGYPFVLKEVAEWMLSHQDLRAGTPEPPRPPGKAASVAGEQRISGAQSSPRSESDIRINYWDPMKIISASNNISAGGFQTQFYSTNGGASWGQTTLPAHSSDTSHSDPTVDWTSDGTAWATTIGIQGANLRMKAYQSADYGATWTFDATFSGAQTSADKQIMWVDHSDSSPFQDNIYAIWHNGFPAFMNRRTGPAGSWQTAIQVSGAESTGTAIGADVKSNSLGDVFGFWPTTTNRKIFVVKSTDGGVSYGSPVQIATTFDAFDIGVPSFNGRRILIYVSGGTYRTGTKDLVYATWTDLTGAAGCTGAANEPGANVASTCKTRIWFSRSTTGGSSWSAPAMLNNQASLNDQFNQWLVVDETTGALGLIYYDTVGDAGRKKTDLWYQSSFDDGVTWAPAVKVTSAQTDETVAGADSGNQYGDYNSLSGHAGVFFASWTDRRNGGNEEIWTAKITDHACSLPGAPTIGTATTNGANQIDVTWSNGVPPATSFRVHRATGTCAAPGTFSAIASALAGPPYSDTSVSGGTTYAYKVSGVDSTGNCESAQSTCAQATAAGVCTLAPTFTGLASATDQAASSCGVNLAWSAGTAACAGPLTYSIYRSTTSGFVPGPANLLASGVLGTAYSDTSALAFGTTYYYRVLAVDSSNGVSDSNSVQRSATPTGPIVVGTLSETFEGTFSGGGFDNPGWTHTAVAGPTDWAWSTTQQQTPTHSWFSDSHTSVSERVLVSPSFDPQASSTLSFWHTFAFESVTTCFDAGTLEISTDLVPAWTVLPDAAFTAGLFNGSVNSSFSNPLAGKRAWCHGTVGAMTQVTANLASFAGASQARLRWHAGDDSSAQAIGWFVDSVTLSNAGVASSCTPGADTALDFFTLSPCRLIDTRNPNGPNAGPALAANAERTFVLGGSCGVPNTAKAVSINVTVTQETAAGTLEIHRADGALTNTNAISFGPNQTRANNAVVALALDNSGAVTVQNNSVGTVHFVVDVNGYFE
jgi:hypothetical protein